MSTSVSTKSSSRHRALAAVIAIIVAGCSNKPPPPTPPKLVFVTRLKKGDAASTYRATGDIHATVESNLSFNVGGKVSKRLVDVGERVTAGALLAQLDSQQQQADVRVAAAALASAGASLREDNLELERDRSLFASGAIPKSTLDGAVGDQANSASKYAAAAAELAKAKETLSYTELRANRAGTITARNVEVGQVVQQGATAFTFSEDGPRDAVFQIDETISNRVALATPFAVSLVDDPSVHTEGIVREIAPSIDRDTASIRIKVALENPPPGLSLGAPVSGSLTLSTTDTFTIPTAAIFSDLGAQPAVWVVDPKTKTVDLRRIVVAAYHTKSVIVGSGLADGDLVVTDGASRLRPSEVIRFKETNPA